jgi:hypothetical protein
MRAQTSRAVEQITEDPKRTCAGVRNGLVQPGQVITLDRIADRDSSAPKGMALGKMKVRNH